MLSLRALSLTLAVLLASVAALPGTARAGTLDLMPEGAWARPLTDSEMSDLRGGFRGVALTTFISVENLQNDLGGTVDFLDGAPTVSSANGEGMIQASISNLVSPSGVFQFILVPGNFNVVVANLTVQIFVDQLPEPVSSLGF